MTSTNLWLSKALCIPRFFQISSLWQAQTCNLQKHCIYRGFFKYFIKIFREEKQHENCPCDFHLSGSLQQNHQRPAYWICSTDLLLSAFKLYAIRTCTNKHNTLFPSNFNRPYESFWEFNSYIIPLSVTKHNSWYWEFFINNNSVGNCYRLNMVSWQRLYDNKDLP